MVHESFFHNGDGLKSTMRMRRKSRNSFSVIHAPSVFDTKILAQVSARQGSRWTHSIVSGGIGILMVNTKEEGITRFPGKTQCFDLYNGRIVHNSFGISKYKANFSMVYQ